MAYIGCIYWFGAIFCIQKMCFKEKRNKCVLSVLILQFGQGTWTGDQQKRFAAVEKACSRVKQALENAIRLLASCFTVSMEFLTVTDPWDRALARCKIKFRIFLAVFFYHGLFDSNAIVVVHNVPQQKYGLVLATQSTRYPSGLNANCNFGTL